MSATGPDLVALAGGRFVMGSDCERRDERPAHRVSVAPFRAARRPVSNAQYALFVEAAGAAPPPFWSADQFCGPQLPVVGVSWYDAAAFCEWWSGQVGARLRLPTEAEREYAARGGIESARWPQANGRLAGGGGAPLRGGGGGAAHSRGGLRQRFRPALHGRQCA